MHRFFPQKSQFKKSTNSNHHRSTNQFVFSLFLLKPNACTHKSLVGFTTNDALTSFNFTRLANQILIE
jgi:hypothetical protein